MASLKDPDRFLCGNIDPPPAFFYRKKDQARTEEEIRKRGAVSVRGKNLTRLDVFATPVQHKNQAVAELLGEFDLSPAELEKEETLAVLSEYWREAQRLLIERLHIRIPKTVEKIGLVGKPKSSARRRHIMDEGEEKRYELSDHDLTYLAVQIQTIKRGQKLGDLPHYGALIKAMIAEHEFRKKQFQGFVQESRYLYSQLFLTPNSSGDSPLFAAHHLTLDDKWDRIIISPSGNSSFLVSSIFGGKDPERTKLKIMRSPELDAESAIGDALRIRFEVENDLQAKALAFLLCDFYTYNLEAEDVTIANRNFFVKKEDIGELKKLAAQKRIIYSEKKNPSSNPAFRSLNVKGSLPLPFDGIEGNKIVRRNFEHQIWVTGNSNEDGLSDHKVYEGTQLASTTTRLYGGFGQSYLDTICKHIASVSGYKPAQIQQYYLEYFLQQIKTQDGAKHFMAKEHFSRWEKAGWLPKGIHALGSSVPTGESSHKKTKGVR